MSYRDYDDDYKDFNGESTENPFVIFFIAVLTLIAKVLWWTWKVIYKITLFIFGFILGMLGGFFIYNLFK